MYRATKTCLNRLLIVCVLAFFTAANTQADERGMLDKAVLISKNKGTIYDLLKDISAQSGLLFIYDSRIINNDKKVKIKKGEYSLHDAIYLITENKNLQIDISGEYILLRLADKKTTASEESSITTKDANFTAGGHLSDRETGEAIAFASVGILNTSIGTITNQDGKFQLVVADSLLNHKIKFSHIGYENQEIDISLLKEEFVNIEMNPQAVSLKEVVVNAINPESVLNDMRNNRATNYATEPALLTTFYREGIDHNGRNIDLTESVLQVYKTGLKNSVAEDQAKLIKKRRMVNRNKADTIFPKMRSGINSCLILDIIKELPEFIDPSGQAPYKYSHIEKSTIDGRLVDVIAFKQNEHIKEPLYTGKLFIETENKALAEVRFEINPNLASKATHTFIDKKATGLKIDLQQARYIVSYKLSGDGLYYINHVRGDIRFKIRRKRQIFSSPLHFWFEMVTCKVDTDNVRPFPQRERLSTTRIFAETKHDYDRDFWKNFNIILPEDRLKENIIRNLNNILVTEQ